MLVWVYTVALFAAVGMKHYVGNLEAQQEASTQPTAAPFPATPYLASPYDEEVGSFHNSRGSYNADLSAAPGQAYSNTTTALSSADL